MNTNSQRCDYIEVLNSYLIEASSEETEFDVDAIRVRLNFVNQLTEHQFLLNKEYLLNTHPALLFKGLIGTHVPNLPGMTASPRPAFEMGMDVDGDFNSRGEWVCLAGSSIERTPERKHALEALLSSGIQVTGYPLYGNGSASRLYMCGEKAIASVPNRLTGESETRDKRDLDQQGSSLFTQALENLIGKGPKVITVCHLPISPSMINSLKHHPAVVNEQYRSMAFLNVIPAAHAEKLMKNMQVMLNMMNESEDPEYYESVKAEIERLRYIAKGDIKSHRDVDSKWVD